MYYRDLLFTIIDYQSIMSQIEPIYLKPNNVGLYKLTIYFMLKRNIYKGWRSIIILQVQIIIYLQHDNYRRISSCVGLLLRYLLKHVESMFYYMYKPVAIKTPSNFSEMVNGHFKGSLYIFSCYP